MTLMMRQHLPRKKILEHGLHKTKTVKNAAVRLMAEKFRICCIFHLANAFDFLCIKKNLHCIVAPKIAAISKQAIGTSDAKGGNLGWIHSLRRLLATKPSKAEMIVIVDVVMEKR